MTAEHLDHDPAPLLTPPTGAATAGSVPHGAVVADALGLGWQVHDGAFELPIGALAGLAVRDNPKRAQLIVSTILGKHVPAPPATIRAAGLLLAGLASRALHPTQVGNLRPELLLDPGRTVEVADRADGELPGDPIVLGFCETATALGHTVADAFTDSFYVHTTRRPDACRATVAGFDEEHSHAVAHHLQPPVDVFTSAGPLILVDDELTTGTTALNTIEALHAQHPREKYVIATLLDLRSQAARETFAARAATLGVNVQVVSLVDGELVVPADVLDRAAPLQEQLRTPTTGPTLARSLAEIEVAASPWPIGVPTGGRHGFGANDRAAFSEAIIAVGMQLLERLTHPPAPGRILVVGTEELMYAPLRLAHWLEIALGACAVPQLVVMQSTTRSPVLPLDRSGYAIRRKLTFPSPDEPGRDSFLYNVAPLSWAPREGPPYSHIVVVTEDATQACWPLLQALQPWAAHTVHLVSLAPGIR